jgi:hypothetical protein
MGIRTVSFPTLVREVRDVGFAADRIVLRGPGRLDLRLHMTSLNQSIEPTGGSRFRQCAFGSQWRLPPVAHARRWAATSKPR